MCCTNLLLCVTITPADQVCRWLTCLLHYQPCSSTFNELTVPPLVCLLTWVIETICVPACNDRLSHPGLLLLPDVLNYLLVPLPRDGVNLVTREHHLGVGGDPASSICIFSPSLPLFLPLSLPPFLPPSLPSSFPPSLPHPSLPVLHHTAPR